MSEPQLERSVLEAKEREELFAIADALGTNPTSRAKKADLVTQILVATGVEDTPAEKPKRATRARKAAAETPAEAGDEPAERPRTRARTAAGARTPRGRATEAAPAGQLSLDAAAGAESAPSPAASDGNDAATPQHSATPVPVPPVDEASETTPAAEAKPTGDGAAVEPVVSVPSQGGAPAATASAPDRPPASASSGPRLPSGSDRTDSNGHGPAFTGPGRPGPGLSPRPTPPAPSASVANAPGPNGNGGNGNGGRSDFQNRPDSPNRPDGQNRSDGGFNSDGGARFDGEPGNRRNRRRRGRDRDRTPPGGGERELAGQSPDAPYSGDPLPVSGYLDLRDEGYGFLRTDGFLPSINDVYVSISQARRFALRKGDHIEGAARPAGGNEKYPALLRIDTVSGMAPDDARGRPRFESLTPLFPDQKLQLELPGDPANLTARIVDLIAPIGKGQRGLIVSPPKAGKTTVLKQIAHSIEANNPDVHLMVLLVDERPEEVTDMRRSVKGEVIASTFDRPADEHTQVAELAIERAKRMVEAGRDVVIVLDGITRLARAYNLAQPATGRIMSGGIDTGALYPPKKFFGAARNIEEGGSLTILATALVETGSRMDEVIFEEFKGTGNMELRLDRRLAERRIYPALDVNGSSTRHEELLFDRVQLQQVWKLRRVLNALGSEGSHAAGLELLLDRIKSTKSNDEFLAEVAKNPAP